MLDFAAIDQGRNNYTSARERAACTSCCSAAPSSPPPFATTPWRCCSPSAATSDFLRYIPYPLKLAHKTGGLDFLNHDAGLFFLENACYYLGVFVQEAPDDLYCKRLIGRISKAVYAFYKEGGHDHA